MEARTCILILLIVVGIMAVGVISERDVVINGKVICVTYQEEEYGLAATYLLSCGDTIICRGFGGIYTPEGWGICEGGICDFNDFDVYLDVYDSLDLSEDSVYIDYIHRYSLFPQGRPMFSLTTEINVYKDGEKVAWTLTWTQTEIEERDFRKGYKFFEHISS